MEPRHQRLLFLLLVLFAALHLTVYSLAASIDGLGIAVTGGRRAVFSMVVAYAYILVAHLSIVVATWYGFRGWHGLFLTTLLIFLYHVVDPSLTDIHNLADLVLQTRFGSLAFFDETIFRLLLNFALALAMKPWFLAIRQGEPSRMRLELSDVMWLAVAFALVGVGFQHFRFNLRAPWKTVEFAAVSIMVCGTTLIRYQPRSLGVLCASIGGFAFVLSRILLDKTIAKAFQAWWV